MRKILVSISVGATTIASGWIMNDVAWGLIAGCICLIAQLLILHWGAFKAAAEVTSTQERFALGSKPDIDYVGEVADEDGDVLPPTPNIGQHNAPYRGPTYYRKD